ncbi:hydroxyectoine utilization dehydratase EutB [Virgibacillus sediminis]|uniref:Hydroxyectoine utilization dehydratase EutB n=1 Tax=Virgibacillus sediminis TaxID=202260 RepID=A0ABV7A961_9BACI
MQQQITQRDVWKAKHRIASVVNKTPLIHSQELSKLSGANVYLKLENLTVTGSFKIRGAANRILKLSQEQRERGITTFSTGNFGMSVAYMAKRLGIPATICISERVPSAKVKVLEEAGAELEVYGKSQDEAEKRSYQLGKENGWAVIHPFDDPDIIAGQGTMGLEVLEELPETDMVIAGLSGGGLHAGLGTALKAADPDLSLLGVSTEKGPAMLASIRAGKPVTVQEHDTLADSLLGGIGLDNKYTFKLVQQYVDDILLISEKEIAEGMSYMFHHHRMMIEGAAAAGIGALLNHRINPSTNIVLVISGGSVDPQTVMDIAAKQKGWADE